MIDAQTVVKAYSGKPGCACGCRGKYYGKDRQSQINRITKVVNFVLTELNGAEKNDTYQTWKIDGHFVAVSDGNRDYCVYFQE